jgi:hypothetical protein
MLTRAHGTEPDSLVAESLYRVAGPQPYFSDFSGTWLDQTGWVKLAIAQGLIVPSDYAGGKLGQHTPITRKEVIVATVRAMGMAYRAQALEGTPPELPFKDAARVPAWARGWVKVAADNGLLGGRPDGTVATQAPISRGEAVVMVERIITAQRQGMVANPQVFVKTRRWGPEGISYVLTRANTPVQIYNGSPMVSPTAVLTAAYPDAARQWRWRPAEQKLELIGYGAGNVSWQAGNPNWTAQLEFANIDQTRRAIEPPHLLQGEFMVPVTAIPGACCPTEPGTSGHEPEWRATFDAETGRLVVPVDAPFDQPNS